jgi:hypothetical protein
MVGQVGQEDGARPPEFVRFMRSGGGRPAAEMAGREGVNEVTVTFRDLRISRGDHCFELLTSPVNAGRAIAPTYTGAPTA